MGRRIDPKTEAAVRRFLSLIEERYDVSGAILFGSRARGTHHPDSDADVAVLLKGNRPRGMKTTIGMAEIACDVLLETGLNVAPLPIWQQEWAHPEISSNPTLIHNIHSEGIAL